MYEKRAIRRMHRSLMAKLCRRFSNVLGLEFCIVIMFTDCMTTRRSRIRWDVYVHLSLEFDAWKTDVETTTQGMRYKLLMTDVPIWVEDGPAISRCDEMSTIYIVRQDWRLLRERARKKEKNWMIMFSIVSERTLLVTRMTRVAYYGLWRYVYKDLADCLTRCSLDYCDSGEVWRRCFGDYRLGSFGCILIA